MFANKFQDLNTIFLDIYRQSYFSDAFALMEGPTEKFIKTGSGLFLKCTFHKMSGQPDFVFW